jgi:hypothetical protein
VGHEFTFRTKPAPGFDGIVHCHVLALDSPTHMVWGWRGGPVDTTVTFTLTAVHPSRTWLHMRQLGFTGLGAQFARLVLASGSRRIYGQRLPAYLDQMTGLAAAPAECESRWSLLRRRTHQTLTLGSSWA